MRTLTKSVNLVKKIPAELAGIFKQYDNVMNYITRIPG